MSSRRRHLLLYFMVVCVGLLAGYLFFNFAPLVTKNYQERHDQSAGLTARSPDTPKGPKEILPSGKSSNQIPQPFILKGVLFSKGKGSALINEQVVKEGDFLEGAQVLRITKNGVELKTESSLIRLSLAGAIEQKIQEQKAKPKAIEVSQPSPEILPVPKAIKISQPSHEVLAAAEKPKETAPPEEITVASDEQPPP